MVEKLLGLAGGLLNAGLTDQMNDKNAVRNQEYWERQLGLTYQMNEKAADNAQKRTIDLYNMLQSPSAMVKQLKEAGLNPALMYSGSGMGGHTQGGAQGGVNGAQGAPAPLGIQNFIDPLTMAQIKNINADTENKEQDTDKKEEETKNIQQDTALKKSMELLNNQTHNQNERKFDHELGILIATQAIQENEQTMLETKNEMTNKQLEILESEAKLKEYEEELAKRFKEKGWDLGSMTGLGSLFIQMGDKLINFLKKWEIDLPNWMKP